MKNIIEEKKESSPIIQNLTGQQADCLESDLKDSGVASFPRITLVNKINRSEVIPTLPVRQAGCSESVVSR